MESQTSIQKKILIFLSNLYDREYDERGTIDKYKRGLGLKYDLSKNQQKISFGLGSEYKYDWGYFDNNGSYEASTKGHIDTIGLYGNIGWYIFDDLNFFCLVEMINIKKRPQ